MEELSFKLSKPITVSKDGGFEEVYELVLAAPSMKDRKQASNLAQFIARAEKFQEKEFIAMLGIDGIQKIQDQGEINDVETGDVKKNIRDLISGSDESLESFYECFETLMLRVCTVLEDKHIQKVHIEGMDPKDFYDVCFEYCENFIK